MRILQLGKYYPPVNGGMETVLRHLCEGLLARGNEVTAIVAATQAGDSSERLVSEPGGREGRLVRAGCLAVCNSQPLNPTLPLLLRRELSLHPPDIVHLHLPNPAACAAWMVVQFGRTSTVGSPRLAIWYHADITRQRLGKLVVGPLVRHCLARADGICVSSEALSSHSVTLARWRRKVTVIPFGIASDEWTHVRRTASGPFLFVGRLVYYKGLFNLIAAMAKVPHAELVIVGDGPLKSRLAERIRQDRLQQRVRLAGELSPAALCEVMGSACALVLPSSRPSETFGLVQIEAMAAGLPVISTKLPTGVAEVNVDGVTGRAVPPDDRNALAGAMLELQRDPQLGRKWGDAGRQRVQAEFRREVMIQRVETWYAKLIAAGPELHQSK
jgi:rhamnosyl/mannosyltransferase